MSDLRSILQDVYDQHGTLTPKLLVDIARPKSHPLHSRFEWNNSVAGEAWRRHQAHELIQMVKVVYREATDTEAQRMVRAFHAVRTEQGHVYEPAEKVADDPMLRAVVLRDMEREWQAMKRRYMEFAEFIEMVRADLDVNAA